MNLAEKAKDFVEWQHADCCGRQQEDVKALEVWHAYILGNEKWLFAVTEEGIMCESYYEVTYNKTKDEFYVDHYEKQSKHIYSNFVEQ